MANGKELHWRMSGAGRQPETCSLGPSKGAGRGDMGPPTSRLYESLGAPLCKEDSQDLLTSALLHCTQGLQLVALAPAKQPPPPG